MKRNAKMNVAYLLLVAVMALSAVGTANPDWCSCEHSHKDLEMPAISDPGCGTSCCDRCDEDNDCCCTFNDRGGEPPADGFLPRPNLSYDSAPVAQSSPESMPRIATADNRCIEPAFTIERLPLHICTTVLLI